MINTHLPCYNPLLLLTAQLIAAAAGERLRSGQLSSITKIQEIEIPFSKSCSVVI